MHGVMQSYARDTDIANRVQEGRGCCLFCLLTYSTTFCLLMHPEMYLQRDGCLINNCWTHGFTNMGFTLIFQMNY